MAAFAGAGAAGFFLVAGRLDDEEPIEDRSPFLLRRSDQGRRRARLDLAVFGMFAGNVFHALHADAGRRNEPHIYVANWCYMAFIPVVAVLHIVNNLAVPDPFRAAKSYSLFSGA